CSALSRFDTFCQTSWSKIVPFRSAERSFPCGSAPQHLARCLLYREDKAHGIPRGRRKKRDWEETMLNRLRNRQKGFTLIELLIVVAIIGIIAALLIPNFLDALQKAKQKRTVADIRNAGTAEMSWLTDQIAAAAAGATNTVDVGDYTQMPAANLSNLLVPQYLQQVPEKDGWKQDMDFYVT